MLGPVERWEGHVLALDGTGTVRDRFDPLGQVDQEGG
jgi:hypothetical protein